MKLFAVIIPALVGCLNLSRVLATITEQMPLSIDSHIAAFEEQINIHLQQQLQEQELDFIFEQSYTDQFLLRLSNWGASSDFYDFALVTAHQLGYTIWEKSQTKQFIDIQVTQSQGLELLNILQLAFDYDQFQSKIIILDMNKAIMETVDNDDVELSSIKDLEAMNDIFFKAYRPLSVIYSWFDILVDTYPDLLKVERVGKTFEGRDMKALRLSIPSDKKLNSKVKTVVITGGIHAREWISVSTACFTLLSLLQDYENGVSSVVKYLEELDFFFLPVMNPDGYDYTWTHDRLWRKNRQQTFHPKCFGIDIDHSFDYHFTNGVESPCSDDYSGESAFEALESYNWDLYLNQTKDTHPIYAYLDLHSYAEEILYPYAYTCELIPRDQENLLELAYGLGQTIRLTSGKYYDVLSACKDKGSDLLPSMGAGTALDYMYHNKAFWAFVLKLRDSGTHGFLLPPKFINPVGTEIYAAVKYFSAFLLGDD